MPRKTDGKSPVEMDELPGLDDFLENPVEMEDSSGQVKAIEAMAIERVDLPIHSMVIFRSYANVYQRV